MMIITRFAGILLAAAMLTGTAAASKLPEGWSEPTVAHQGTRVMQAGGQTMETQFRYLPPGKQREEISHEGMSMAMIIRHDLGVVWTIMPGGMYMEISLEDAEQEGRSAPSPEGIVEFEKLGTEEVNGWPTTRYRVITREDGEEAEGDFWVTEHWIPIRMEITMRENPQETVKMEIRDLLLADQDPTLFEVPAGATEISGFSGFSGFGGMPGAGERGFGFAGELADEAAETARDTAKQETSKGVKDAVREGVRGLFKR